MRVVVKIGTSTATEQGRLSPPRLLEYAKVLAQLTAAGHEIAWVSSGAVAAGREALGIAPGERHVAAKQMLASVGQPRLMALYGELCGYYGQRVAQVLLTRWDLERRRSYLNARRTFEELFGHRVLPIVNENDTVATEEIRVGDNDQLSALVANLIDARLLVLLTDQQGLYDADPRQNPGAQLVRRVDTPDIPDALWQAAGGKAGMLGTGGMLTKLRAADIARRGGTEVVIASGEDPVVIAQLIEGREVGTRFTALTPPREARKRYILSGLRTGTGVAIDGGAETALAQGKSLLGVGVKSVSGEFDRGDTVTVHAVDGRALARGIANYGAAELKRIAGKRSSEVEAVLGYDFGPEFIHRDDLVML
ncbi:MAG: glutamate 5-kinase [Rhodanobacteraceae bacterium]|nr:glutamate 5-kinase [Rhodanobacteraceae bacterium]